MTGHVTSADGSSIAYDTTGSGPALILVGGAFNTRGSAGPLAAVLEKSYRVYAYDRRGRGDSTETKPYAPDRELEDLAALIEAAGGSAMIYGHSSGAALALEAASSGLPIARVAAYEPPYTAEEPGSASLERWSENVEGAVNAGDLERAAVLFLEGTGADPNTIEGIKQLPWWPGMLAVARTLPYDLAIVGDGTVPTDRFRRITVPTLILHGGDSPSWAGIAASAVAQAIPDARHVTIEGQDHNVDAAVLAQVLVEFLG
ncbi:MAG: alpha/beta hydrolase [Cryobacterium sp.]